MTVNLLKTSCRSEPLAPRHRGRSPSARGTSRSCTSGGHGGTISLSLAHKRWSQGETGRVIIEEVRRTAPLRPEKPTVEETSFLASLALSGLPSRDLFALYQGWLDRVAALEAAQITGTFAATNSAGRASALREGLDTHARLQRDIAVLRAQAAKEKQLNRRVELNLEIKRLEAEQAYAKNKLQQEGTT
jgi:hypothetical protein